MPQAELTALREEIARLTGGSPSLKRARQKEFLLLMYGPEDAAPLTAAGYTVTPLGPRRWGVEPPGRFYCLEEEAPPKWRRGYGYQLYRMVAAHETRPEREVLRGLVKALEAGEGEQYARETLALCAQRLREKQSLPGGLAPWLTRWLLSLQED